MNPLIYQAALDACGVFDLRDRAKIELAGKDARDFLHNLCTQDVKNLPVGASCEAFLTTNKARVIAHVWIWQRKDDTLLLDFAGSQRDKVIAHLNHYLISEQVEITDRTTELSLLRLIGPRAIEAVTKAGVKPTRKHPLAGLEGCEVFLADAEARLVEAGAVAGDPATYEVLRVEAGLPEFGRDIDENRLAMEVNRPQAITYTKGCYLGQETIVMARDRGQTNRLLVGVKLSEPERQRGWPASGAKLFRGADEVGHITSSVFSPRLQQTIALAYLRRGSWDAGIEVAVEPISDGRTCVVAALPFLTSSQCVLP